MLLNLGWLFPEVPKFYVSGDEDPPPPTNEDPPSDDPGDDGGGGGGGNSPTCATGSRTFQSVVDNGSSSTASYRMTASYSGNSLNHSIRTRIYYYQNGVRVQTGNHGTRTGVSNNWNSTTNGQTDKNLAADDNRWSWRGRIYDLDDTEEINGSIKYFKSHAIDATSSTPEADGVTADEAYIACKFFPNTLHSTATVQMEYKKSSDSGWTVAGEAATAQGYSEVTFGRGITGLDPSTQYDIRLVMTRNTENSTSHTSATASFTTLAGKPSVTTNAVTSITNDGGTLNDSVTVNQGTTVTTYWKHGTDNPPTQNTTSSQSVSADASFSKAITGLNASTTYYAQAFVAFATPSGSPVSGSVVSFATLADPAAEAADQHHVPEYEYYEKYGVATTVYFSIMPVVSNDVFLTTSGPFAAGDVKISKDGGNFANTTNLPSIVSAGKGLYKLSLTAAEMGADFIHIYINDAAGGIFRDLSIKIWTTIKLSEVDIDSAAGTKTNTSAVKLSGHGTNHGLEAVAGATGSDIYGSLEHHLQITGTIASSADSTTVTLDASAVGTNDEYNGAVILFYAGAGAGQARIITDYVGGTKAATLNKALGNYASDPVDSTTKYVILGGEDEWAISPAVELASLPDFGGAYADLLQCWWQRTYYKRTETATVHNMFESDGSTAFAQYGVDSDGSTETKQKAEDQ